MVPVFWPERFADKTIKVPEERNKKANVEKKSRYSSLPFKGETPEDFIYHRLSGAVDKKFRAAKL